MPTRPVRPASVDAKLLARVVKDLPAQMLERGWLTPALQRISEAAGAEGAVLLQTGTRTPDVPYTPSLQRVFETYFAQGWHTRDLRQRAVAKILKTGVGTDQDFATREMIEREPYYAEFLGPLGLRWFAGIAMRVGADPWCVALQRTARQGLFGPAEQAILRRLHAPLSNAAVLARALEARHIEGTGLGLDNAGQPALILGRHGRVLRSNTLAERMYSPLLRVSRERLATSDGAAAVGIEALSERVTAWQPRLDQSHPPIVIRRHDMPQLLLRPLPLPTALDYPLSGARAIVLVDDLRERPAAALMPALQLAYRLTPAEARMAELVAGGLTLRDAADHAGVAVETARSQFKAVRAKTGTANQRELVALLARLRTPAMP